LRSVHRRRANLPGIAACDACAPAAGPPDPRTPAMLRPATWLCLFVLLALSTPSPAQALRCGNRLVTVGDFDFQVLSRCGEPYWVHSRSDLLVAGIHTPLQRRQEQVVQDWYYNFGPRHLVRRLRFVDDQLVAIDSAGYGARRIGEDCSDIALRRGSSTGEVFLRCGAPAASSQRYQDIVRYDGVGNAIVQPVLREQWRYQLPGSRFVRLAIFHDGQLDRVERVAP
jgi:hypothetical protein